MTFKEAKEIIRRTPLIRYKTKNGELKESLMMAMEVLENAEKYKWHDMKNNPTDLPPMNESVLALIGNNYYVISLVDDDGFWEYQDCYGNPIDEDYNPIIAWREIDAFEVTE